jgi:hypothetical protein
MQNGIILPIPYRHSLNKNDLHAQLTVMQNIRTPFSFLFFGKEILATGTLADCGIRPGYEIHCVNQILQITLSTKNGTQLLMLVGERDLIQVIRRNVHHHFNTIEFWLQLFHSDTELLDDTTIDTYPITHASSLRCIYHCVFSVIINNDKTVYVDVDLFDSMQNVKLILSRNYHFETGVCDLIYSNSQMVSNTQLVYEFVKDNGRILRVVHTPMQLLVRKEDNTHLKLVINAGERVHTLIILLLSIQQYNLSKFNLTHRGRPLLYMHKLFTQDTEIDSTIHIQYDIKVEVTLPSQRMISLVCDKYQTVLRLKEIIYRLEQKPLKLMQLSALTDDEDFKVLSDISLLQDIQEDSHIQLVLTMTNNS